MDIKATIAKAEQLQEANKAERAKTAQAYGIKQVKEPAQ